MKQDDHEVAVHPDEHFHHLYQNLPEWLLKASAQTRDSLKNASLDIPPWHGTATRQQHEMLKTVSQQHWGQRNHLSSMLANLHSARDFAEPLLAAALNTRFNLALDVKTTFLRLYIPLSLPLFAIKSGAARTWTVSLLDAALHNFQASEAEANAYERDSTFITEPSPSGRFETLPHISRTLTVQEFVRLCRELDIGRQYNAYLKDNLGLTNRLTAAVLQPAVIATHKAAFRSALLLSHASRDIDEDAGNAIYQLTEGLAPSLDGQTLHAHDLTMMSSSLTGIVIFGNSFSRASKPTRIIAYIPDDPEHPLKQYPDTVAFMHELTRKLRSASYQTFFSRFVDHQERGHFFADLNSRLQSVAWHQHAQGDPLPAWRETPIDKPNLRFSLTLVPAGLWNHLYQRQLNKILNDASTLAVSTEQADQAARWALWDAFSKVASTVIQLAAFVALPFVPFLGELMLAYMAYQVLDETFEGIVDWAQGAKSEAFGHLIGFVETVVQLGTFAIGGAIAAGAFARLLSRETVALLEPLKPVQTPAGRTRYWQPDLRPYEHRGTLPKTVTADNRGLYQHQGQTLLPLENKLYAVEANSENGVFQILHPERKEAYQPPLRHNNHGAWQTKLEQPLSWDRETVMRRLGHSVDTLTVAEREQVLRISGFHDNVLREVHVENHRPPSLLTDTIKRFKIDRDIQALIEQPDANPTERYLALSNRKSLFEFRYRTLEQTGDRQVQLLLGDVTGLPTDIAAELVANATGTELMHLHAGRVPQRLKDVALKAMEAVRVARAYEGFYREEMDTTDTHRLALHSLESMPGWPDKVRIEVRDFSAEGVLGDSIGDVDASIQRILVHADDGSYQVHGGDETPSSFYSAILQALPEVQRNNLGAFPADGQAFKQRIAEHAQNNSQLRKLFARHPNRKPFYDPTTMRLPGGTQGYSRIARNSPTLDDRVREVFPRLARDELNAFVARLQRHPNGARVELSRLSNELESLHRDLDNWVQEAPATHHESGAALSDLEQQATLHNRSLLAQEIQRSWRRQSDRDFDTPDGIERYTLRFSEPLPGNLPKLTANFDHVSVLSLEGNHVAHGLPEFLQQFPNLRRLELRRFDLGTLPDAVAHMPNLDALVLNDCGIRFDAAAWSIVSSMKRLTLLDLYQNPIETLPNIDSLAQLFHLDLSHTDLTEIPLSALRHPKLDTLMLIGNRISELPPELFDSTAYNNRGVHLSQNPLSNKALETIKHQYFETVYDLGVYAPATDIERVKALYPKYGNEQASEFVYELSGTLEDGRVELKRMELELSQLNDDLSAWTADLPTRHPSTGEPFTSLQVLFEHSARDEFKQLVERCWRQDTELDDFNEALEPTYELVFKSVINGQLPTLSATFERVSMVELVSADGATQIGRFLESFPNLKSLKLLDYNLGEIPAGLFKMGQLRALSMPGCSVALSAESVAALAGMENLDYLDLSQNPLGNTPDLSQMPRLATVLLHETGITEIPRGLMQVDELDMADLSDNAITDIPGDLQEMPLEVAQNLILSGNRFSDESLSRLISYFERTGVDFGVQEVIDQGQMEVSSSEGSEVDE